MEQTLSARLALEGSDFEIEWQDEGLLVAVKSQVTASGPEIFFEIGMQKQHVRDNSDFKETHVLRDLPG